MRYEDDEVIEEVDIPSSSVPVSDVFAVEAKLGDEVSLARGHTTDAELLPEHRNTEEYSAELLAAKTLHEFVALLYEHEDFRGGEPLLGVSAGEVENACESFIAGIFMESIEQHTFPEESIIVNNIARFVEHLGLPDEPQMHEHMRSLLRDTYEQRKNPDMIAQLRSETVRVLNAAQSIEEFEHILYQEVPPERASYISRRLQHVLQGTSLHFADGLYIRGGSETSHNGGWWNDPTAEAYLAKTLLEYAPLPYALDREHLAHLLLDWTFREENMELPERAPAQQDTGEASLVVTGREEFDELRPTKKSEDVSGGRGYPELE